MWRCLELELHASKGHRTTAAMLEDPHGNMNKFALKGAVAKRLFSTVDVGTANASKADTNFLSRVIIVTVEDQFRGLNCAIISARRNMMV